MTAEMPVVTKPISSPSEHVCRCKSRRMTPSLFLLPVWFWAGHADGFGNVLPTFRTTTTARQTKRDSTTGHRRPLGVSLTTTWDLAPATNATDVFSYLDGRPSAGILLYPDAETTASRETAVTAGRSPPSTAPSRPKESTVPITITRDVPKEQPFKVFCDLDGVLVDFEHGIRQLFPDMDAVVAKRSPTTRSGSRRYHPNDDRREDTFQIQDLHRGLMWERVSSADSFFEHLPWTADGKRLWNAIKHLQPDILTGVPSHRSSRLEKVRWCQRELPLAEDGDGDGDGASSRTRIRHVDMAGPWHSHSPANGVRRRRLRRRREEERNAGVVNVITCWSHNKYHESGPGAVLIDDRESLRADWEARGGIFVHHTGDADATLRELRRVGVLTQEDAAVAAQAA